MEMNGVLEVEITQPGRPTGIYTPLALDQLKLEGIYYPKDEQPFDVGMVPRTADDEGEYLRVLLLSNLSHPPKTLVPCILLGGIKSNGAGLLLLVAPLSEKRTNNQNNTDDIIARAQTDLTSLLKLLGLQDDQHQWVSKEKIIRIIKQASIQYRRNEAENRKKSSQQPSWQPADRDGRVVGYTEAEHYTEAEYTFFKLPYHFQHYVNSYLSSDERILFALRRLPMRSQLRRSWLGGEKLQEGVMILTTQRLLQLVELTPPGSSGVRYGFNAQLGALERLENVWLESLTQQGLVLKTQWRTGKSIFTLEWEFPYTAGEQLTEMNGFLYKFIEQGGKGRALRRATPGPAPECLPRLSDPAANRPEETAPIHERFTALLPSLLEPGEVAYAWALWPAWFKNRGYFEIILVTDRKLQIIPDPETNGQKQVVIQLADIAALEYTSSILESHIGLFIPQVNEEQKVRIEFPYPAEGAFHACFEALRRCMAVASLYKA